MQSYLMRPLTGTSLLLFTAIATASPVVLDTEQKAAAGVATAFWTSNGPPPMLGRHGSPVAAGTLAR